MTRKIRETDYKKFCLNDNVLFILTVDDMAYAYDLKKGEGSFDKLNEEEKIDLALDVKKNLEHGLGDAWAEYMDISVGLALDSTEKENN
jgi:hypothetical protein